MSLQFRQSGDVWPRALAVRSQDENINIVSFTTKLKSPCSGTPTHYFHVYKWAINTAMFLQRVWQPRAVITWIYTVDLSDCVFFCHSLKATYWSWNVHSVLNKDTVGLLLFLSNVLIEHSHDIPHPPFLPRSPPPCPSFHSQLCSAPFHTQTATKTTLHILRDRRFGGTFWGKRDAATT